MEVVVYRAITAYATESRIVTSLESLSEAIKDGWATTEDMALAAWMPPSDPGPAPIADAPAEPAETAEPEPSTEEPAPESKRSTRKKK